MARHYKDHGRSEGRNGNCLKDRNDFVALIPEIARTLEIGPFCAPVISGKNVRYFDVLDQAALRRRAEEVGYPLQKAPFIDFVSPTGDLSIVEETFDFVVSSHCIEHQPDVIDHLQKISRILEPGGRYFVLVPDKRYCFDAFLSETNIAEIIGAHCEGRTLHSLRSVIEHRALITHNNCALHWAGQHGDLDQDVSARIAGAVMEYERSKCTYIDVHAWQFTPASISKILPVLGALSYINLHVERLYPTRRNSNEFWFVLRKTV